MGTGSSIPPPINNSRNTPNDTGRQTTVKTQACKAHTVMNSLQHHMQNYLVKDDKQTKRLHIIEVTNDPLSEKNPIHVKCGDIIEFQIKGRDKYDIFQVYKDGDAYYRIEHGYELFNIKSRTPENNRRLLLSLYLPQDQSAIDLYFCVSPSSQRKTVLESRTCPKDNCEFNWLKISKHEEKIILTDEENNQKVFLHKGDIIELDWSSGHSTAYHIEEKKYCPISGGLYSVEQTSNATLTSRYRKTFNELGMSFLFRLTNTNQIHDITVCVINDTYKIKYIEINDKDIQPNIISIEQNDWIMFQWKIKREPTIVKFELIHTDEIQQKSIELINFDEGSFCSKELTYQSYKYHQFTETGVYCYKNTNGQISTIIVESQKTIHQVPLFTDKLIYKINTNDLVEFNWKAIDSQEEPLLITVDTKSSVISDTTSDRTEIFDCCTHKCCRIEPFFRHHFHTCETFLLNIPKHGLYNFAYSNNPDHALISVIVESGINTRRVICDEENRFQSPRLIINRLDQVLFLSSSTIRSGIIYETDKYGNRLEFEQILFKPPHNIINYSMRKFSQLGIYYFSTDIHSRNKQKSKQSSEYILQIIVLPEISFHYKLVYKGNFAPETIITTNKNNFIIWEFDKVISHDVIKLCSNGTFKDLISCHDTATIGRKRQCLAVDCKRILPGVSFFCNPDFERVTGSYQDRLISTVINDSPFSQNCFVVTDKQFVPNILYIQKNNIVSWILNDKDLNHRISVQSNRSNNKDDENTPTDRNFAEYFSGIHSLHIFNQKGTYIIKSDRFRDTATVVVQDEHPCIKQKQIEEPTIIEEIDPVSQFDTQIHFDYQRYSNANIYYTLDGSSPTQHNNNVHLYNPNEGVHLCESGLHLIRAYATEDQRLSSSVIASSPTFVLGNEESQPTWNSYQTLERKKERTILSASLPHSNKIYGKIEIESKGSIDRIDHSKLFTNNIAYETIISSQHCHCSVHGSADGEQYDTYVVAYPKDHITNVKPIRSNELRIDFQQEIKSDVPTRKRTVLSSDSESRVQMLLEKLTLAIENRSEGSNSTYTHPLDVANQLLSQRSNNNIDEIYKISANDGQGMQRVRSTTLIKKNSLLSADIAVPVDK